LVGRGLELLSEDFLPVKTWTILLLLEVLEVLALLDMVWYCSLEV
jgi:hypothetical protein